MKAAISGAFAGTPCRGPRRFRWLSSFVRPETAQDRLVASCNDTLSGLQAGRLLHSIGAPCVGRAWTGHGAGDGGSLDL